ncbi:glycosyl transferase [Liquorilactobacillus aquaticus DSM 21051]|uniref:UDP-N-acetylglucosamine--peptide N-acetylglucosaminyltransferase stabilizing protein GtfB n=2 Tax=Liquorilactobacillus aquaticus TaxID=392566 RepID=A0A0R2D405_9LACO|nr:glycosyl transferase [Liquorilactobacillus aquaticus DSM 21051]
MLDLYKSLIAAGYTHPTVVLEDDGWLPVEIESPYSFFLNDRTTTEDTRKPLFFNQVCVPKFWEIKGDNNSAAVFDYDRKAAEIIYASPKDKRLVKEVKWLDKEQRVRSVDHYNKFGRRFAGTIYNIDGQVITKTYYSFKESEVIVENFVTNDIILNYKHQIFDFQSKEEFVQFYLELKGYVLDRIFYNSLSYPFFVSLNIKEAGEDILFWQEPLGNEIPGNMQIILNGQASRTHSIIFNKKSTFEHAKKLWCKPSANMFLLLGYVYEFERSSNYGSHALIITNSDNIEKIDYLIKNVPKMHFNIAAITEMSPKLGKLALFPNVTLFPNISHRTVEMLWQKCDYYLDINHEGELMNAVRKAFLNNLLILSFSNILHDKEYLAAENIYNPKDVRRMSEKINKSLKNDVLLQQLLQAQKSSANEATVLDYQNLLK